MGCNRGVDIIIRMKLKLKLKLKWLIMFVMDSLLTSVREACLGDKAAGTRMRTELTSLSHDSF